MRWAKPANVNEIQIFVAWWNLFSDFIFLLLKFEFINQIVGTLFHPTTFLFLCCSHFLRFYKQLVNCLINLYHFVRLIWLRSYLPGLLLRGYLLSSFLWRTLLHHLLGRDYNRFLRRGYDWLLRCDRNRLLSVDSSLHLWADAAISGTEHRLVIRFLGLFRVLRSEFNNFRWLSKHSRCPFQIHIAAFVNF